MKPFKPPTPLATNTLMGLCVAVEAAALIGGPRFVEQIELMLGLIPARETLALSGQGDLLLAIVTPFSHMLLHSGLAHLGLNMLFLAWVGRYVEWVTGRWALVGLFVAGGVAGGLLQVLAGPHGMAPIVGASGAIAAIFGAYAVLFSQSRVAPRRMLGITISAETINALWYAAAWIGLQLLTALVFNVGNGGSEIAIWTHIGGFITGLLLARLWGPGPQPLP